MVCVYSQSVYTYHGVAKEAWMQHARTRDGHETGTVWSADVEARAYRHVGCGTHRKVNDLQLPMEAGMVPLSRL